MSAMSTGEGRVCGFMPAYMSVSCSHDQLCMHCFLWSSECVCLPKCVSECVKVTGSGCVWRWRTSPQGVLFLVFQAHSQRCPLWDLWRERGRRERWGREGRREDRGHGVRGELGCTRSASLSMLSRGEWCWEVCIRRSLCVFVSLVWISSGLQEPGWAH